MAEEMTKPSLAAKDSRFADAACSKEFGADWVKWMDFVHSEQALVHKQVGPAKLAAWRLTSQMLSAPRHLSRPPVATPGNSGQELQLPWMPLWPRLTTKPIHDQYDYDWTETLRQASADIRNELWKVCDTFAQSEYQSDARGEKSWQTYVFFSRCRPNEQHLAACPRTREVLTQIPHNGMHVCFSAMESNGILTPHTGPTNASLTAHLGLLNCDRTKIWAGGQVAEYRNNEVLVFDDSFVHWVKNDGAERRYTLMFTFWHPDLNAFERKVLFRVVKAFA